MDRKKFVINRQKKNKLNKKPSKQSQLQRTMKITPMFPKSPSKLVTITNQNLEQNSKRPAEINT